ncbi:hypothetical protein CYMTET_41293 [Cymbomonas tetramitiformis]|uniref:HEAT repeat domain-containing protein n=1 Tax=Cymbomonas tetramitiformis TaxID=36881 RepID=A0AAE0C8E7_9CHLO|nr:hypothetical protein CYMTET_41293 [Cymbomonas tetramitiformis]
MALRRTNTLDVKKCAALGPRNRNNIIQAALEALAALEEHAAHHAGAIAARLQAPHAEASAALLEHADEDVRRAAVEALGGWGSIRLPCRRPNPRHAWEIPTAVRKIAVKALGGWGHLGAACGQISGTAGAWRLGEHAAPHAGAIVALLEHANGGVTRAAVKALGRLGEHAAPHAGAIVAQLEHARAEVRWAAVQALVRLGEHAVPHAGAIAALLEHANGDVRKAAVEALGRLGEHAAPHAGAIVARLEHADEAVRAIAARLEDDTEEVWVAAVEALRPMSGLSRHGWKIPMQA